jgi:EmrB/QacA subfamily drug resistance transporter
MTPKTRAMIVLASMLAVFLGALDALIVATAMPTIVSDLGGLDLYSWVFSAYMLFRTVSLPIFGKLCDIYSTRKLFVAVMGLFVVSSTLAGMASTMPQLIGLRAVQGFAAGGTFAVAYTVVTDISLPEQRGRVMGFISMVWGVASVLGPGLGGLLVTFASWRWIFYINVPVGIAAILAVWLNLREFREKRSGASIDYLGATTLSASVLALLFGVLLHGKTYNWDSPQIVGLLMLSFLFGGLFLHVERRAADPILRLGFMRNRGFVLSNAIVFLCSFAIFSLIAFIPLFIQGALARPAADVSVSMIPLSFGWSLGGLISGNLINRIGTRTASIVGSSLICAGISSALTFSPQTSIVQCCVTFGAVGIGMGFTFIATLIMAQRSLSEADRGVATSSQQFALNLGGTLGVGISGSILVHRTVSSLRDFKSLSADMSSQVPSVEQLNQRIQDLMRPEFQASFSPPVVEALKDAVAGGVIAVFWSALLVGLFSLVLGLAMPGKEEANSEAR